MRRIGMRLRGAVAAGLVASLLVVTVGVAPAAAVSPGGFTWVKSSTCKNHSLGGTQLEVLTVQGIYLGLGQWANMHVVVGYNACGASAPYGSYPVSSTKQIALTFKTNRSGLQSCEGGFPWAFSCTYGSTWTSASWASGMVTKAGDLEWTNNLLGFFEIQGLSTNWFTAQGLNQVNGNMYWLTAYNSFAP